MHENRPLRGNFELIVTIVDTQADKALKFYQQRDTIKNGFNSLKIRC